MLLTNLAQDGRNHRKVEISKSSSATDRSVTNPNQGIQGQDDEPEEDSSSIASFVTCPEAESSQCTTARGAVNIAVSQPTDKTLDEASPAETLEINVLFSMAKGTLSGDKGNLEEMDLPSSASGARDWDYGRDERDDSTQWWYGTILRRRYKTSSEPKSSETERHQLGPLLIPATSSLQAATCQDEPPPETRPQATGNIRKAVLKVKSLRTTNELGQNNLADLYARFDNVRVEGWRADLLEIDAREGLTQDNPIPATTQEFNEFGDATKWQCRFCKLYFVPEQNVRDLDNGSSPCSHHPGKKQTEILLY